MTIIGLDVIRFLAAILVTCFHLSYWAWASPSSLPAAIAGSSPLPKASWAWFGWIGVQIFFVLSGLLIAQSADGRSSFVFVRARMIRLFPAVWICASLSLAVRSALGIGDMASLGLAYTRTMLLFPLGPWIDSVYWTLAVEVMFYAAVNAVLLCGGFARAPRLFDTLALLSAGYWTLGLARPDTIIEWSWPLAGLLLLRHGCFFALGGFFWLASIRGATWPILARIGATVIVCIVEIWSTAEAWRSHPGFGNAMVPITIWLVAIAAMASAVRWCDVGWSPIRAATARAVGLATFPLYLLHAVVGAAFFRAPLASEMRVTLAIFASVGLAFVVSTLLEPPFQRLLRMMIDRIAAPLHTIAPLAFRPSAGVPRHTTTRVSRHSTGQGPIA